MKKNKDTLVLLKYMMRLPPLIITALLSFTVMADNIDTSMTEEEDFVDEMSLGDLLNISVSSTTKSDMTIQKAPGVIRGFTARQIKRYHFKTL